MKWKVYTRSQSYHILGIRRKAKRFCASTADSAATAQ